MQRPPRNGSERSGRAGRFDYLYIVKSLPTLKRELREITKNFPDPALRVVSGEIRYGDSGYGLTHRRGSCIISALNGENRGLALRGSGKGPIPPVFLIPRV
jgi:hypothetical protein